MSRGRKNLKRVTFEERMKRLEPRIGPYRMYVSPEQVRVAKKGLKKKARAWSKRIARASVDQPLS